MGKKINPEVLQVRSRSRYHSATCQKSSNSQSKENNYYFIRLFPTNPCYIILRQQFAINCSSWDSPETQVFFPINWRVIKSTQHTQIGQKLPFSNRFIFSIHTDRYIVTETTPKQFQNTLDFHDCQYRTLTHTTPTLSPRCLVKFTSRLENNRLRSLSLKLDSFLALVNYFCPPKKSHGAQLWLSQNFPGIILTVLPTLFKVTKI